MLRQNAVREDEAIEAAASINGASQKRKCAMQQVKKRARGSLICNKGSRETRLRRTRPITIGYARSAILIVLYKANNDRIRA